MKRNKALYVISLLFYTLIPLVIFFIQYSPSEKAPLFKISIGSIVVLIFIILALKKFVFRGLFEEIRSEMSNLKAQYIATPTDTVRKAWIKRKIIIRIFDSVPILLSGLAIVFIANALEKQLIELSGAMICMLISIVVGVIIECVSIISAK